ncbi:MAG: hypothetical protein ACOC93_02675 [Planctomycetota bacterium]
MRRLTENPLLYRGWWESDRPVRAVVWSAVALGLVFVAAIVLHLALFTNLDGTPPENPGQLWRLYWDLMAVGVAGLQALLLIYLPASSCMDWLPLERAQKTEDLLVTLPLTPTDKVVGLSLAPSLKPMLIALELTPVQVGLMALAGAGASDILGLNLLLWTMFAAASTCAVALGARAGKSRAGAAVVGAALVAGLAVTAPAVTPEGAALVALSPSAAIFATAPVMDETAPLQQGAGWRLFTLPMPWQFGPLLVLAYVTAGAVLTARARLRTPTGVRVRRGVVLLMGALLHVLALGVLGEAWRAGGRQPGAVTAGYLGGSMLVVLIWLALTMPQQHELRQWLMDRPMPRLFRRSLADTTAPPLLPGLAGWAMPLVSLLALDALYWDRLAAWRLFAVGGVLLIWLLAYATLLLAGRLMWQKQGLWGGIALVALALLVPAVAAAAKTDFPQLEWLEYATPVWVLNFPFAEGADRMASMQTKLVTNGMFAGLTLGGAVLLATVVGRLFTLRRSVAKA